MSGTHTCCAKLPARATPRRACRSYHAECTQLAPRALLSTRSRVRWGWEGFHLLANRRQAARPALILQLPLVHALRLSARYTAGTCQRAGAPMPPRSWIGWDVTTAVNKTANRPSATFARKSTRNGSVSNEIVSMPVFLAMCVRACVRMLCCAVLWVGGWVGG